MSKIQKSNMTQTDSKGKVIRKPKDNSSGESQNFKWWIETDNEMVQAQQIAGTIKFIAMHQSSRIEQLTSSTRLYGNSSINMMGGAVFARTQAAVANPSSQRISFNLCASVIDTLTSRVAKNKVVPTFITQGGDWKMQMKAKKLTKFADGIFYQTKAHEKSVYCFRDAGVWGKGWVHPYREGKNIFLERVLPHEILVDQIEAINGDPRQLHRVKVADRGVIIAMFPEKEDELNMMSPATIQEIGGSGTASDLLTVTESYHLRSSEDSEDGWKIICCGDVVLHKQEWKYDYFPFPSIYYSKRIIGDDGQGACERLQGIQLEINKGMITIQRSHWLQAGPKVALENTSKIVKQHLNNDIGAIITYTNNPPIYMTPPIIQAEVYSWVDSLIDKGYRQEGVSEMSAASKMPAQELSGRALRSLNDMESERFLFLQQQVEAFSLEVINQMIDLAVEIYEETGSYETTFPSTNFLETIDWKDIKLKKDEYILKAYPTSSLPNEPSARLQTIQEQMQAGLISPRQGRRLMSSEDIEMSDNLANAPEDLLCKIIEEILEDGEYTPPEPFFDLTLGKQLSLQYMNYAVFHNCPKDNLALLQQFITQIDDLMGLTASPPPQAMAGTTAPMANPQATPTSPLIPNSAGGMQ